MIRIARKNLALWATIGAVFFLLIQVSCDLYLPTVTADLVNRGIVQKDMGVIWNEGIKMMIVAAIGLVAAGLNVYFAATQSMKVGEKLRSQIYHKVLRFSNREMDEFGDSSLITRSTNDIVQIQNVMVQMLRMMLQSPVMLVAACVLAYVREPQLTKVFFISLPILAIIVMVVMYFAVPLFKSIQKKTDRINLIFREGLTGVRVIRAFRQEEREQNRFKKANEDYTQTGIKAFTIVSTLFPVVTLILGMTNVAIILLGGHLVAKMSMQVGDLIAFMTYATQIMISFMMLSMIFVFVPRASASATRVNAVLDQPISIHNAPEKDQEKISINQPASLEFKNVDFRFHGAERLALHDLNFKVTAGQTLAIIGGTGSGKSALVNLIPRLFDIESGEIKVDGVPVKKLSQHNLHEVISITQQQAVLFSGTIRSNLQFGYEEATDKEMWHALEIAQAADFVREEGGLDAVVEQNGSNFSGGQRQRLAIARTIIKPASIYVFDDSFSALDFETDAKLRAALAKDPQIQRAVTVIVAQRISTVVDADQIIVLDEGRVVGQGTHQELKAHNETYQQIIKSQVEKGDVDRA
ncbi:multidrug ABC transporter ATP-binding protein [Limosilactobacillus reuteri]|uniref:Multidrug ABC transporter ATP-binding protein n=1 Tax=Limosilactobacillus reuteri TaxID=1598 RepID=A0A1C1ZE34_LIMRT|nr:ABC transporter ATP-binding protein [Limosilactobacillus reuteri]MCH5378909.1 ABC transporter ATP-binding protein/permease [Limosilactobacillus reuteri]OCW63995.1 multidrug ABC transporter ATP-binding protein [Limosilactobacillus reuteri]OCW64812.1 multidrug ABC transporter ATP-binding protein [Limosilactobacillus reuteri]OCW67221.1 multidrug ABC transporter ATP-binding protein [Limosilactobacillus reuteri]OCW69943.1 multidrug ABC transporter ATP-binding protein [Limosilactobacillus reuteri